MIRHYLILFIAIFIFYSIQNVRTARKYQPPPKYVFKPRNIRCESDNKTILVKFCYIKAYSRYVVNTFLGLNITTPVSKPVYVQMVIKYRYGLNFHQVIDTKLIEWCSAVDGAKINPLAKLFGNFLAEVVPHLFHKCPYEGDLDLVNFTASGQLNDSQVFPTGIYRYNIFVIKNNKHNY